MPPSPPGGHDHVGLAAIVAGCGLDSVWMGDHNLMVEDQRSPYPYSKDGLFPGAPDVAWFDWVVALATIGGAVPRIGLGVAVTVPVLREPIILAKQIATLDRLSGGRVVVGVGTGWLAEEFEALDVPFAGRGARLDACLDVLREVWTGRPRPGAYGPYRLSDGLVTLPTPAQVTLPVLVAGDGEAAMDRAIRRGQGWLTVLDPVRTPIPAALERIARFRERAGDASTTAVARVPVRSSAVGEASLRTYLHQLVDAGVGGFVCDVSWASPERTRDVLGRLDDDLASVR